MLTGPSADELQHRGGRTWPHRPAAGWQWIARKRALSICPSRRIVELRLHRGREPLTADHFLEEFRNQRLACEQVGQREIRQLYQAQRAHQEGRCGC